MFSLIKMTSTNVSTKSNFYFKSYRKERLMLWELIRINLKTYTRKLISIILFFLLWEFLCWIDFNFIINFVFVPTPVEVINAFIQFINDSPWVHFKASILRVIGGFISGSILGIFVGLLIGSSKILEDF